MNYEQFNKMSFRLASCLVATSFIIVCFGFIAEEQPKSVTFKNVRIRLISQRFNTSLTVYVQEASNLKPFIISNKTDTIRINNEDIPMLYENSVTDIPNVAVLDLSSNGIQAIEEGAFGNLGLVQALNLSSNHIRVIRSEVFPYIDVRFLFLSHNTIFTIEDSAFENLDHLYFIDLSYNRIRTWIWRWFKNTPVKGINMRHNLLDHLPEDSFRFLDEMAIPDHQRMFHHLLFSHNDLKSIDKLCLPRLKKLVHFDLSHNSLRTLEVGTFNTVENVDHLDVSYNYLMYLDRNLFKFTYVNFVNLKANYLIFVNADFMPMVNLDLNPLDVNTRKKWLEWRKRYGHMLDSPEYSS